MLRHIISLAFVLLFSGNALGQFTVVGKMAEVDFMAVTCIAKKLDGYPRQLIVRTNHPAVFFADMEMLRMCIVQARYALVTEPQKHKPVLYPRPEAVFESVLVGNVDIMECMIGQVGGKNVMMEFSFPWLADSELGFILTEQIMKVCLGAAKPPKAVIGSV